jgi:hypothetical protein
LRWETATASTPLLRSRKHSTNVASVWTAWTRRLHEELIARRAGNAGLYNAQFTRLRNGEAMSLGTAG